MACKRSAVRSRLAPPSTIGNSSKSPSSRGLGHCPFTAATGVRIPLGTPYIKKDPPCAGLFICAPQGAARQTPGSTKRASVLDARRAPRRGENRPEAIRINPLGDAIHKERPALCGSYYMCAAKRCEAAPGFDTTRQRTRAASTACETGTH